MLCLGRRRAKFYMCLLGDGSKKDRECTASVLNGGRSRGFTRTAGGCPEPSFANHLYRASTGRLIRISLHIAPDRLLGTRTLKIFLFDLQVNAADLCSQPQIKSLPVTVVGKSLDNTGLHLVAFHVLIE